MIQRHQDRDDAARLGGHVVNMYAGNRAFKKGLSPVDCPYTMGTPEHACWMLGWEAGFDDQDR